MPHAGGLRDQPLELWIAVNYAAYVWSVLEQTSADGFKFDMLSPADTRLYTQITDYRARQIQRGV